MFPKRSRESREGGSATAVRKEILARAAAAAASVMAMPAAVEPAATASAIVGGWVTGRHVLHIEGYSRTKAELPTGESIESRPFRVGGRSWSMVYYPNGFKSEHSDFICIFLRLVDDHASASSSSSDPPVVVKAKAMFSLLDRASNRVPTRTHTTSLHEFSVSGSSWGLPLIRRSFLEKSEHLRDDCFRISCDVMIPPAFQTEDRAPTTTTLVAVPPPDLSRHLGDLLTAGHGADVAFQVAGETFGAHRYILAARSPVFRAQFLGAMRESSGVVVSSQLQACPIRVADMEPQVFRALLAFLYTDTLPDYCSSSSGQENEAAATAMLQHLLVAADRYDMERLKLVCEDSLCKHIDTGSVATILALAEQHNCQGLKKACFQFMVKSPSALKDVLATDGFQHLARSCPAVLKELLSNSSTSYRWYQVLVVTINLCFVILGLVVFMNHFTPVKLVLVFKDSS